MKSRLLGVVLAAAFLFDVAAVPVAEAQRERTESHSGAYGTGAAIANIWYVPGRALVCGGTVLIAATVMTLTLGHSYDDASRVARGGCSGPWLVQRKDIRQASEQKPPDAP
jgi:hypothetical protein